MDKIDLNAQRALFEANFGPNNSFAWRDADGNYKSEALRQGWKIWQAALAAQAQGEPVASDAEDAARWRALLGSARIRMLGSAGLVRPKQNNYARLGMEIWTKYGSSLNAKQLEEIAASNELGREWLTKYADIARAAIDAARKAGEP